MNSNLEAANNKQDVHISYKDGLTAALKYSKENSAQTSQIVESKHQE